MTNSLNAFATTRQEAATILETLSDHVARALSPPEAPADPSASTDTHPSATRLSRLATRTRGGRFRVLLLGAFSSGKSSLLNALVGQPLLPVKVNPCTAVPTQLEFGETPRVELTWRDGAPTTTLTPEAFSAQYQLHATGDAEAGSEVARRFGRIERATVFHPTPLLEHGIVFLDTPGLDDDIARTERTMAALPHADAVLLVLNSTRFLTQLELQLLRGHLQPLGLRNLFFPVTMVDLLELLSADPAAERERMRTQARRHLGPLCVVDGQDLFDQRLSLLDARTALASRWDRAKSAPRSPRDETAAASSGLTAFETALHQFLVQDRGRAQLRHIIATVRAEQTSLKQLAAIDAATAAASIEELEARRAALEPQFRRLEAIADRVARRVDEFVSRQRALVWADLEDVIEATIDDLPGALEQVELGAIPSLRMFGPAGRERLASHLRSHLESWLQERLDRWQQAFRDRLSRSVIGLREELQPEIDDFDRVVEVITSTFTGTSMSLPELRAAADAPNTEERWLSLALGAVLLSPGTMAAGWSDGLDGVTLGAASRIGARVAVVTLGAMLGPIGQASLLLYAAADTAALLISGDRHVHRTRTDLTEQVRDHLLAQRPTLRAEVEARVDEALTPLRTRVVEAARADAAATREMFDRTVAERIRATEDAHTRAEAWSTVLTAFDHALAQLAPLVPPAPESAPQ